MHVCGEITEVIRIARKKEQDVCVCERERERERERKRERDREIERDRESRNNSIASSFDSTPSLPAPLIHNTYRRMAI